ncbi:hypothetical protein N7326_04290 [Corynebacterium sp. ES2794-CONJ1]|uniref:hypothetical protein n=1 Tax=unclassified Corynebacterium TaxID=2624378 RepID=UPI0021676C6B|nr:MULTISPECIES: hypothetical protein [unclassified Corynebacterium]MCS4490046.1 hypothetical protein [Corynebacterium sp. ES2775-CONJ]MCS4491592.1 hypothetical protein [Corynebacterium sp. ES2715-CONJ3]MCS4531696.1 hypothetical protein [Corynebacterium sp. ES2730-CONJ]MCU9519092.1 hypothetical protein [Corynebacterium sp. ES2794-CONJ1]
MSSEAIFRDVTGISVSASMIEEDGHQYLALDLIDDEGHPLSRLLTLNRYDAKQMSMACEHYLRQQISADFTVLSGHFTSSERESFVDPVDPVDPQDEN